MSLESAAYISNLVASNPVAGDPLGQGYQHINLIKQVLQSTFPNLNAAVTGSPAALNAAALAFNQTTLTLPSTTSQGSAILLNSTGATVGNTTLQTASGGLRVVAQGPTPSGGTAPAPVTEIATDGSGNVSIAGVLKQGGSTLLPTGVILLWSGAATAIPAGYALCDGTNGTPDLRNSFVVGAGSTYAVGATGGVSSIALTTANLPAHNHGVNDAGHTHTASVADTGHTHTLSLNDPGHGHSLNDPGHKHSLLQNNNITSGTSATTPLATTGTTATTQTVDINSATTGITVIAAKTGITASNATAPTGIGVTNASATTGITTTNTGSGTAFSNLPPYYALCYIMKL